MTRMGRPPGPQPLRPWKLYVRRGNRKFWTAYATEESRALAEQKWATTDDAEVLARAYRPPKQQSDIHMRAGRLRLQWKRK